MRNPDTSEEAPALPGEHKTSCTKGSGIIHGAHLPETCCLARHNAINQEETPNFQLLPVEGKRRLKHVSNV